MLHRVVCSVAHVRDFGGVCLCDVSIVLCLTVSSLVKTNNRILFVSINKTRTTVSQFFHFVLTSVPVAVVQLCSGRLNTILSGV